MNDERYQVGADQIADCKARFAMIMTESTQVAMEYFAAVEKANELEARCKAIMAEYSELNIETDVALAELNSATTEYAEMRELYAPGIERITSPGIVDAIERLKAANEKYNAVLEQSGAVLDRYEVALREYTAAEFACNHVLEAYIAMQKKSFMALTGCEE